MCYLSRARPLTVNKGGSGVGHLANHHCCTLQQLTFRIDPQSGKPVQATPAKRPPHHITLKNTSVLVWKFMVYFKMDNRFLAICLPLWMDSGSFYHLYFTFFTNFLNFLIFSVMSLEKGSTLFTPLSYLVPLKKK